VNAAKPDLAIVPFEPATPDDGDAEPFEAGEPIFREGEPASILFLLIEGEVAIERAGRALRSLRPQELFGEEALRGERVRRTTARARLASRVLPLGRARFEQLAARRPELRELLARATERDAEG